MGKLTSRLRTCLDVASSVAVIVAAGAFVWTLFSKSAPAAQNQGQQVESVKSVEGLRLDSTRVVNVSSTGRFAIVEFFDFQCPFCARHAAQILPALERDLIGSGTVRYLALHFPLESIHPLALRAAEAAECAGVQGRFWEMHERLFQNSQAMSESDLVRYADAIGVDGARFGQCMDGHETLAKIRADQAEGRRLGVNGTPAFFIGVGNDDGGIELLRRVNGITSPVVFSDEIARLRRTIELDSVN